ncbi:MAG: AsmA-like C-terminal domain-containing protein [Campylobacterales bacterium]
MIKTALSILIFFILIVAFFFALLQTGLNFEKVSVGGVEIGQLYLKIDKKLILEAEHLTLAQTGETPDPAAIVSQLRRGFLALYFVERIHIQTLQTPQGAVEILYEEGLFSVKHERGEAVVQLGWMEPGVAFEIKSLRYAQADLTAEGRGFFNPLTGWFYADIGYASTPISGTLNAWGDAQTASLRFGQNHFEAGGVEGRFQGTAEIDLDSKEWRFEGDVSALAIEGDLVIIAREGKARASLLNATAKTLEPLSRYLPVGDNYRPWISGKITARHFEAKEFSLDIDLSSGKALFDTIYLDAFALDGDIRYHPDLPAATAAQLDVFIANDSLHIFTREGQYETQPADAYLHIHNLSSKQGRFLNLQIDTPALFDRSIQNLLAAYGAKVDIEQYAGSNHTLFTLQIDLSEGGGNIATFASGQAKEGSLNLYGLELLFDAAELEITGNRIDIARAQLNLPGLGSLSATGRIEAGERRFDLQTRSGHLRLMDGLAVDMQVGTMPLLGEWNATALRMSLPDLGATLQSEGGRTELSVANLAVLKPHIPLMELFKLSGGTLGVVHDPEGLKANFQVDIESPIFYAGKSPITRASGRFESGVEGVLLNILEGRVVVEKEQDQIRARINQLEVDVTEIEKFYKARKKRFKRENGSPSALDDNRIFIFGNQTALRYQDKRLATEWFSLHIDGDRLEGQIKQEDSALAISRNKSDITLRGEKLGATWVRDLSGIHMTRGSWDLTAYANLNNEDLYGVIRINNAAFKEARFITNVIALVNTLPSLVQFRSPGFTAEGFTIERGVVEFYYASDTLFLNAVRLVGTNTDIIAQGSINLKTKEVNIYASVQTVKSASSLISKVPLLGYLLLGEEKAISNVLHITGTLEKPEVKSEIAKEIIFYPLSVIERTLTLPLRLFEP